MNKVEFCSKFEGYLGQGILAYTYHKLCIKNNLSAEEYKKEYKFNIHGGMFYLIMHPVNRCRNKPALIAKFIDETKAIEKRYMGVGIKMIGHIHKADIKNKLVKKDYNDFWREVNLVVKNGLMNEYKEIHN